MLAAICFLRPRPHEWSCGLKSDIHQRLSTRNPARLPCTYVKHRAVPIFLSVSVFSYNVNLALTLLTSPNFPDIDFARRGPCGLRASKSRQRVADRLMSFVIRCFPPSRAESSPGTRQDAPCPPSIIIQVSSRRLGYRFVPVLLMMTPAAFFIRRNRGPRAAKDPWTSSRAACSVDAFLQVLIAPFPDFGQIDEQCKDPTPPSPGQSVTASPIVDLDLAAVHTE